MNKKTTTLTIILSIIAIILSLYAIASVNRPVSQESGENRDIQYVLYLGTNDKDTNEPVFEPEEAKEKAKEILIDHFGGYTIQEANGGWIDGGKIYQEYTLVIYLSDTDLESVHKAADDMVRIFRQSSVLIQANETTTEFYAGEN